MKYIITEAQRLKMVQNEEAKKKVFFKYWDKFGPEINQSLLSLVGEKMYVLPFWDVCRKWLREYLGEDVAIEMAKGIINKAEEEGIQMYDCGTYQFKWTVRIMQVMKNGNIELLVYADPSGSFTHIETGVEYTLGEIKRLTDNEEIEWGWEILDEINGCIDEKLINMGLTTKTGFELDRIIVEIGDY